MRHEKQAESSNLNAKQSLNDEQKEGRSGSPVSVQTTGLGRPDPGPHPAYPAPALAPAHPRFPLPCSACLVAVRAFPQTCLHGSGGFLVIAHVTRPRRSHRSCLILFFNPSQARPWLSATLARASLVRKQPKRQTSPTAAWPLITLFLFCSLSSLPSTHPEPAGGRFLFVPAVAAPPNPGPSRGI